MSSLVSVIIPTKNRADLLDRALKSVVNQTYADWELIVVNDGSTDQTRAILGTYQEKTKNMTVIHNDQSVGAARARNQAVEAAAGEFIAGLDDDDSWHKNRLRELMVAYSDKYSCITSDTMMVYPARKIPWRKKEVIDLQTLLFTNQVGNQVLVKKHRLMEIGGYDELLKAAQDYDLWVRLCDAFGPVYNVQKVLQTVYMDHQQARITDLSSAYGYLQFYQKHKPRMSREQRKYQLYKIRRAQGKPETLGEFLRWVPPKRYTKEVKRWITERFLGA